MPTSQHHLILGGQRSGKSRHAERLARQWLSEGTGRAVTVLATAVASDAEMQARIARHRRDRPAGFDTVEVPLQLGQALRALSRPEHLLVVDCLVLWLTNVLMPTHTGPMAGPGAAAQTPPWPALRDELLSALQACPGPVVLVSNEIGCGVVPLGAEVRRFVDELGRLHQDVVRCCAQLTWMVAGQPFTKAVEHWS